MKLRYIDYSFEAILVILMTLLSTAKECSGCLIMLNEDEEWFTLDADEALERLSSDKNGLSDKEAASRLEKYGPNCLEEPEKDPRWKRLVAQFNDPLIFLLMGAVQLMLNQLI